MPIIIENDEAEEMASSSAPDACISLLGLCMQELVKPLKLLAFQVIIVTFCFCNLFFVGGKEL